MISLKFRVPPENKDMFVQTMFRNGFMLVGEGKPCIDPMCMCDKAPRLEFRDHLDLRHGD